VQDPKNIEQEAGESLAQIWDELDRKAQSEKPGEYAQAQKLFEEWAGKLANLLSGGKK